MPYKNSFRAPQYIEQTILNNHGAVVGTIRIKPSTLLWKKVNGQKFYSVPLGTFTEWITHSATKARTVKH